MADDDLARRQETVAALQASNIEAYPPPPDDKTPEKPVMDLIRELRPRIVVCRPSAAGVSMFYPLRSLKEPPMVIVLSSSASAKDEVHYIDRLIIASIRAPVRMAALCQFIRTALTINARLDDPEDQSTAEIVIHPAVGRFTDPILRMARPRTEPAA
ncbi:hypothetical protein FHP25_17355 [Vineibacter terrae]|uniref:Uncharacterized protein n=1 Tax=Vineibacter terrae TaxID=2586908 RepID=A0A5C8PK52_9HYPH|nr:hypothetical protein [Vineibacter terrae]TXL74257.1 hypothetical protein FHP25_17355 [Vineibacter terrae]